RAPEATRRSGPSRTLSDPRHERTPVRRSDSIGADHKSRAQPGQIPDRTLQSPLTAAVRILKLIGTVDPLLSVRDVSMRFGGIVALDQLSLDVERGAITGLIGPNGAGKTTVFNCITRIYTPQEGAILFE